MVIGENKYNLSNYYYVEVGFFFNNMGEGKNGRLEHKQKQVKGRQPTLI